MAKIILPAVAGIAFSIAASPAGATTPSSSWFGVERIAIVCHADAAVQSQSVCNAVAAEARRRSGYPVVIVESEEQTSLMADFRIDVRAARSSSSLEVAIANPRPGRRLAIAHQPPHSFVVDLTQGDAVPRLREMIDESLDHFLPSAPRALSTATR